MSEEPTLRREEEEAGDNSSDNEKEEEENQDQEKTEDTESKQQTRKEKRKKKGGEIEQGIQVQAQADEVGRTVVFTTDNPYLTRPARRQAKKGSGPIRQEITHHSSDYNIWYHKKLGDRFEKEERVKALTRCSISKDAGYTRADINKKGTYFCLYFARGHCSNGAQCSFFHRIPTEEDELKNDLAHDIFGRERHRTYRDDMGGVGSFSRENRTLHITGFQRGRSNQEIFLKHFSEWGEIENIRVVSDKAMAFVKYKLRACAEFGKEAMLDQSLDNNEVLAIRWANEDPNPKARQEEELKRKMQLAQTVAAKRMQKELMYQYDAQGGGGGGSGQDPSNVYSADHFPSEFYSESAYPNTDQQYQYSSYYQQQQGGGGEEDFSNTTTSSYSDSSKQVEEWLKGLQLGQYVSPLLAGGYFDFQALSQLDEIGLDAVNVTNSDHRKALLLAADHLKQWLSQSSSSSSSSSSFQQQGNNEQNNSNNYYFTNPEYEESQQHQQQQQSSSSSSKTSNKGSLVPYTDDDEQ